MVTDTVGLRLLDILLSNGGDVNALDGKGLRPLSYAAFKGYPNCAFKLIQFGSMITEEDLKKLNLRIPNFVETHLNRLISMRGTTQFNSRILLGIDLRLTGTINSPLKNLRETSFINFLIEDGQRNFLTHPTIETFLTVKWIFVRKYFILSIVLYVFLVTFFTLFVIEAYVHVVPSVPVSLQNVSADNTFKELRHDSTRLAFVVMQWLSLLSLTFRILYVILIIIALTPRVYLRRKESWIHLFLLVTMILSHCNPTKLGTTEVPDWQNRVAAVAVLFTWVYFLHYLRRQPSLGIYVEMLITVFTNIFKFLLTYTCLLIGFAISFMVLYRKNPPFSNPVHAIVRVLNMMVGEMSYETLFTSTNSNDNYNYGRERSSKHGETWDHDFMVYVFYILFIITVTIALINLLIGLAVSDIEGLRKQSKLNKIMREVAFITDLEEFINSTKLEYILHPKIYRYLRESIQVQSSRKFDLDRWSVDDMTRIFVYPNDSNDRRLVKELKKEALAIAIQNQLEDEKELKLAGASGSSMAAVNQNTIDVQLRTIQSQVEILLKRSKKYGHM